MKKDTVSEELDLVMKWHAHWMMNEPGYFERAASVDANMRHDLAHRIREYIYPIRSALQEARNQLAWHNGLRHGGPVASTNIVLKRIDEVLSGKLDKSEHRGEK